MNSSARFEGKNVLITGSTGGIGQALASRFYGEGARLILVDMDPALLAAQTQLLGTLASSFVCDVSQEKQCFSAYSAVLRSHPKIDIAVLNAGVECPIADLDAQSVDDFDRVMAVNARGVFIWLSLLMKTMKAQSGGVITVTSSTGGLKGSAGMSPYVASKHAVMGLMKCAALEGASFGVRVNTVNPGPVKTRMIRAIEAGLGDPDQVRAKYQAGIPLKRYGRPEEIAAMVAFLSSDESGFSTGASFVVDGGAQAGNSG